jgi:hypothetical protein
MSCHAHTFSKLAKAKLLGIQRSRRRHDGPIRVDNVVAEKDAANAKHQTVAHEPVFKCEGNQRHAHTSKQQQTSEFVDGSACVTNNKKIKRT